jgi:hypothetical protein
MKKVLSMKITLILSLLLASLSTFASDYYTLRKNKKNCFVKAYKNKEFEDVPYKRFESLKILARPHKKDPTYMVFKVDNQIYITKYKCLEEYDIVDEADLPDSKPEENHIATNSRVIRTDLGGLKFSEKKYFISLDYGIVSVGDKSPVLDYEKIYFTESGENISVSNLETTNYKSSGLLSLAFGWRANENRFYSFKYKRFSGQKDDEVNFTSEPGPGGIINLNSKDEFQSYLFGGKYIFMPTSKIKPYLSGHIGLSHISSVHTSVQSVERERTFSSSGLAAELETGFEVMLNDYLGFGLRLGYEILGTRTFILKETEDDDENRKGFKSLMDYSNLYTTFGLITYF